MPGPERPHAHLLLNARVVQLTGPADANVIQMTETVRALVDAQRAEVVGAFSDLQAFLLDRLNKRTGKDLQVYKEIREILPTLGDSQRPLTVPEILLLMMIDRSLPALPSDAASQKARSAENALTTLPQHLSSLMLNPNRDDSAIIQEIEPDLDAWKTAVTKSRDWCSYYTKELDKQNGLGIAGFRAALDGKKCPIPTWIALRMKRSLELTERLYPDMVSKQTKESLVELERRFGRGLDNVNAIMKDLADAQAAQKAAVLAKSNPKLDKQSKAGSTDEKNAKPLPPDVDHELLALQTAANELVSAPLALFNTVMAATDGSAPSADQLIKMIHAYALERGKLSAYMDAKDQEGASNINYAKLETLEASLNLWLRRASEAMSSSLEQQFYSGYVEQLRLLATKALGKSSNRDILSGSHIEEVPDIERDLLLSGLQGVNVFVSNSISMQFAQDVMNSVSAKVQGRLPNDLSVSDRIAAAGAAATTMAQLKTQYGFDGTDVIQSLLAGGEAVPVSALNCLAKPVQHWLRRQHGDACYGRWNETLAPDTDKVTDRVTNHSINGATISALSYEPMVVSTLASNLTYYESTGGFPVLRQIPGLKNLLNDVPFSPFKIGKRQKGVYQSSVIILEPVVIPTIEDLVRYHSGWETTDAK